MWEGGGEGGRVRVHEDGRGEGDGGSLISWDNYERE